MPWRVDITAPHSAEAADLLIDLGALDLEISSGGALAAILPDAITPAEIRTALHVQDLGISPAISRDDGSVWLLTPRPLRIGSRLHIRPASVAEPADPQALRLNDSDAFGTGHHPTTTLCLEALDELISATSPPATMLDVGTGSGILALAALRLGVNHATGIDTDARALEAAAANAGLNGLEGRLRLHAGGPDSITGTWPLVAANVLTSPLIEMAPALVRRLASHGFLILSGIRDTLELDVSGIYRDLGLHHIGTQTRDGWAMLLMQASW